MLGSVERHVLNQAFLAPADKISIVQSAIGEEFFSATCGVPSSHHPVAQRAFKVLDLLG